MKLAFTPQEALEINQLLVNCCQILDSPNDPPMSEWDKEQRLLLGQFAEKFYQFWKANKDA